MRHSGSRKEDGMYGFPDDLDLSHLIGGQVVQVCIDRWNVLLTLNPENRINLCGSWRLLDASGNIVDEGDFQEPKDTYRIHQLLGHMIELYEMPDRSRLEVIFDNRWTLDIHDSEEYECCHISPNIYI